MAILATLTDESMKKQRRPNQHSWVLLGSMKSSTMNSCCFVVVFVVFKLMKRKNQATVALSADQCPKARLIVPLLQKLKCVYSPETGDNTF